MRSRAIENKEATHTHRNDEQRTREGGLGGSSGGKLAKRGHGEYAATVT